MTFFHAPTTGRANQWRLQRRTLTFGRVPLLMGIINVTPDSFSDGGCFVDPQAAIDHGLRLEDEGAGLLDIGGESTRPYARPVPPDDELRRVLPVVEGLVRRVQVPISIDTSKAAVARAALEAGAEILNDITALTGDPAMLPMAVALQPGICAMHMQGTPLTMQNNPTYADVVEEILVYLRERRDVLQVAGVAADRICLDPGIGFGKTTAHNVTLLANMWRFHVLGCPLLVGHSRKGFMDKVLQSTTPIDRTAAGIGVASSLARQGVQILRVHDVGPLYQGLQLFAAAGGLDIP